MDRAGGLRRRSRVLLPAATVAVAALLVSAALGASTASSQARQQPGAYAGAAPRPNVVLLMADDMNVEELDAMPYVRRALVQRGVSFTRAYAPDPSCCPARATLLTGQYAQNHGVYTNKPPGGGWPQFRDDEPDALPVWLGRAGYATSWVGKYLNAYPTDDPTYVPVGWDRWHVPVDGIYNYKHWVVNDNGAVHRDGGRYQVGAWGDEASAQVERLSAEGDPFFMTVSFLAPHAGTPRDDDDVLINGREQVRTPSVAPRDRDAWSGRPVLDKPNLHEDDVSDKPQYVQDARPIDPKALREAREQRRESLRSVDREVRHVVRALRAQGELDDTVVVFTSDNGYLLGEHGLQKKSLPYEESVRVPLVVRGPGFGIGADVSVPVSQTDLSPTLLDLSGAVATRPQDGVSLLDVLDRKAYWRDRDILLQYGPPMFEHRTRMRWAGVRGTRWAYYEYEDGERELYDMRRDPYQLQNLAQRTARAELVKSMHAELAWLQDCEGAGCRPATGPRR